MNLKDYIRTEIWELRDDLEIYGNVQPIVLLQLNKTYNREMRTEPWSYPP